MRVPVKALPPALRDLLRSTLEYGSTDIALEARESVSRMDCGGQGRRAYFAAINLATGQHSITWGSWGGANPYAPNPVDLDDSQYPIPAGVVVIKGSIGYPRAFASLYALPTTLAPMLPAAPSVSKREAAILGVFNSIKGGYRARYLEGVATSEIESLIHRRLLKKNKAGAISITTEGKNASSRNYDAIPPAQEPSHA